MTDVVLLHGAFRGAWAWDAVRPRLEAAGHRVLAPDLPGAGERFVEDADPVDLQGHVADIAAFLVGNDVQGAVVVGHSQGGFLARAASQQVADRIGLLAYLDAPVPQHGQTAFDLLPGRVPGDPPPPIARTTVMPPTPLVAGPGVTPEQAAAISARLTPQGVALSFDPVALDDPAALALPEVYAFCALTPDTFPCATTRARLDAAGVDYDVLDAAHDAPVTAPELVAAWILGVVSGVDGTRPPR